MKKFILLVTILFAILHSFSQKPLAAEGIKIRLLEKSKKEKIGACFLFVIGGAVLTQGITTFNESDNLDDASTGIGVAILGGACVLTSIPLYLYASKNKKRLMSLSINQQSIPVQLRTNNFSGKQTAIFLKFQIGR